MYTVLVKVDGFDSRRRNSALLHIVLGFYLVLKAFDFYGYSEFSNFFSILPVLAVAAASLYYGFFRRRIDPSGRHNVSLRIIQATTFIAFGIAMIKVGKQIDYYGLFVWAILTVLLLVSERKIFTDTIIYFQKEGVKVPGYYKDYLLEWPELEEVVVRHDFITIFNKNKKYLQFQVMQTLSELEVAKMNAFCKEELEKQSDLVNKEA